MPPVTRVFVRTGLLYLLAALLTGLVIVAQDPLYLPRWIAFLTPAYFHLFMVGWVTQLIIGVAYWMFPKLRKEQPRGSDLLAWSCYGLLNIGLILRIVAEPIHTIQPRPLLGWLIVGAALLQWLGGLAFVLNTWPRVKVR